MTCTLECFMFFQQSNSISTILYTRTKGRHVPMIPLRCSTTERTFWTTSVRANSTTPLWRNWGTTLQVPVIVSYYDFAITCYFSWFCNKKVTFVTFTQASLIWTFPHRFRKFLFNFFDKCDYFVTATTFIQPNVTQIRSAVTWEGT